MSFSYFSIRCRRRYPRVRRHGRVRASGRAAARDSALMQGSWSCTYHGPKGTQTSTLSVTSQNSNWVLLTSKDGAYGTTPAHESATLVGYDSKKGQYVGFGGNTLPGGDWGVGTAKAAPTATSFTVMSAYPPDPTHDKTAYTFTSTTGTGPTRGPKRANR